MLSSSLQVVVLLQESLKFIRKHNISGFAKDSYKESILNHS